MRTRGSFSWDSKKSPAFSKVISTPLSATATEILTDRCSLLATHYSLLQMPYEAVIGLEVHVQVKTRSKMFTRVAARYGEPPNTLTDPVVLALPGALPVMNRAALDRIVKVGLMLGCEIAPVCKWDRKNYFYPDSPKNYQISQYDQPICRGGVIEIELPGSSRNVMGEHKRIP